MVLYVLKRNLLTWYCFATFLENAVVRKKAREWVHRNKQQELAVKANSLATHTKKKKNESGSDNSNSSISSNSGSEEMTLEFHYKAKVASARLDKVMAPLAEVAAWKLDPFEALPNVGRSIDHILQYCKFFLSIFRSLMLV